MNSVVAGVRDVSTSRDRVRRWFNLLPEVRLITPATLAQGGVGAADTAAPTYVGRCVSTRAWSDMPRDVP